MVRNLVFLSVALLLAGCDVQSRIQGRYVDTQDQCKEQAEDRVGKMPNAAQLTPQQQSAEVVNQFSQCMNQAGWHVANPLKSKDKAAADNSAPPGQPAQQMQQQPVRPQPQPYYAPVTPQAAPPAYYQRTIDAPVNTSNGRQF